MQLWLDNSCKLDSWNPVSLSLCTDYTDIKLCQTDGLQIDTSCSKFTAASTVI